MAGGLQPPDAEEEEETVRACGQGVLFVIDEAQLEVAQVGKVCHASQGFLDLSRLVRYSDSLK